MILPFSFAQNETNIVVMRIKIFVYPKNILVNIVLCTNLVQKHNKMSNSQGISSCCSENSTDLAVLWQGQNDSCIVQLASYNICLLYTSPSPRD